MSYTFSIGHLKGTGMFCRDFEFFKGLAKHGSKHVRELFLRPSIAGDQVACLGVSEPGAGSDVAQVFNPF